MRLRSTLTTEKICAWRMKFGLSPDIEVRIPLAEERAQSPPEGFITVSEGCLKAGFRIPPSDEALEIFKFCGVPISQFSIAGMTRIMGLICFFREHGSRLSLEEFRDLCDVCPGSSDKVDVRSNKNWLRFEEKADYRHGGTIYGFIKNRWRLPEVWRALPGRCRRITGREDEFSSILGFSEREEFARNIFFIGALVDERRLVLAGLSPDIERDCAVPLLRGKRRKLVFSIAEDRTPLQAEEAEVTLPQSTVGEGGKESSGVAEEEVLIAELPEVPAPEPPPAVKEKRRASSSLVATVSKIRELGNIAETWNEHYVGLKDDFLALRERLREAEDSLLAAGQKRERDASRLERATADLTSSQAEVKKFRAHIAVIEAANRDGTMALDKANAEMFRQDAEVKTLKEEVSRLRATQVDVKLVKDSAIAEFRGSLAYMEERSKLMEQTRAEIMTSEVEPLLEDEFDIAYRKGFEKGLRAVQRKVGCSIEGLDIGDASGSDSSDVDIEG